MWLRRSMSAISLNEAVSRTETTRRVITSRTVAAKGHHPTSRTQTGPGANVIGWPAAVVYVVPPAAVGLDQVA